MNELQGKWWQRAILVHIKPGPKQFRTSKSKLAPILQTQQMKPYQAKTKAITFATYGSVFLPVAQYWTDGTLLCLPRFSYRICFIQFKQKGSRHGLFVGWQFLEGPGNQTLWYTGRVCLCLNLAVFFDRKLLIHRIPLDTPTARGWMPDSLHLCQECCEEPYLPQWT